VNALKVIYRSLLFCFLTVLTQTGGIAYLFSFLLHRKIDKVLTKRIAKVGVKLAAFLVIHLTSVLTIVPLLAKLSGRAPLPLTETRGLQPLTIWTCLLNRHYVVTELREAAFSVSAAMQKKHPGTVVNYLDENFPFFNGFPLILHLSHNDGRKLDLAFCYTDRETGEPADDAPSLIGYGICEEPRQGEANKPRECAGKGRWQYSFLEKLVPQGGKDDYVFDTERTKHLVELFASDPSIEKIFIEPHLRSRLNLTSSKTRFHGCHAVRHDDHIHVQLK
jgi:hypothetical protein